jgi:hypothetical protein
MVELSAPFQDSRAASWRLYELTVAGQFLPLTTGSFLTSHLAC